MYSVNDEVDLYKSELIALRRDFHQYPEVGYKEFRTSKNIFEYLKNLGFDEIKNIDRTGVVASLFGYKMFGETVILRVNMDALPIKEETDTLYKSKYDGVMHASGHDAQMAVALVVAKILKKHRDSFQGTVKFVFQPNEEQAGALNLIENGIIDESNIKAALAMNFTQMINYGSVGLSSGLVIGNTEEFVIRIYGKSGNTYLPHKSIDAILGAAKIIENIQLLQTREYDPFMPMSIMFGKVHGGSARNVVADNMVLEGTIRFISSEKDMIDKVKSDFRRVVADTCHMMRLGYEVEFIFSNSELNNDEQIIETLKRMTRLTFGKQENIVEFKSLMGEDFAEFAKRVPSAMTFFGINEEEKGFIYPNYHSKFDFNEDIMVMATEYFVRTIIDLLRKR